MLVKSLKQVNWQIVLILFITALFRFYNLGLRAAHHDEGINGWFADIMLSNHYYRYDPANYHGPLHFYIIFLSQALFGHSNFALRLPTVLISILSVYLILLFSKFLGKGTCIIAACAMAISCGCVYFGRFAIHEFDLVFFNILVLWGIIGFLQEGMQKKYLYAIGFGIALMICTKETYIVHLFCLIAAYFTMIILERLFLKTNISNASSAVNIKDLVIVIILSAIIIIFFYSGTFLNFKGVSGIYETFGYMFSTGTRASGHAKPFLYWANLFMGYEQIALIGLLISFKYIFSSSRSLRYISIYGLGMFFAYSIIPYKTPWCVINLLWPFYLIFGDAFSRFFKSKFQTIAIVSVCALFAYSLFIAYKLNFINYENPKESYVYVQTFNQIKKFTDPLFKLVNKDVSNYNLKGFILRSDEWPLPWLLNDFTMIGYFGFGLIPHEYNADFLVVETRRIREVESNLSEKYFTDTFFMREAQDQSKIYFSYEKFKNLFPGREPEFLPVKRITKS